MRNRFFFILSIVGSILLGLPTISCGQSKMVLKDSSQAATYTSKGNDFASTKKYDSAIFKYNKAAQLYMEGNDWNSFFYSQFQIGYYLNMQRKYSENITYLDSIETNYGSLLTAMDSSYQRFYGVKSWAHFKQIQLEKALYYFTLLEKAGSINKEVTTNDKLYAVFYKGIVYQRIGQYDLALAQMNLAKDFCNSGGVCNFLGNTYNNLGIIYRNLGEYERAAEFYQKALTLLKQNNNEVGLTPIYNNLGKVYLYQEKYAQALKELNYAINVLTDYTSDYYQVESALINSKSNVLIKMKRYDEAEKILKKVYAREVDKFGEADPNSSETLFSLGKLYAAQENFKKSNEYLHQAIGITQQFLGMKNDKSAGMSNLIGLNMLSSHNYRKAVEQDQTTIINLVTEFDDLDIYKNPTLKESILDRVELVDALYQKGEALHELYIETGKTRYLEGAKGANKTCIKLVEQVRNRMLYESSIVRLSEKVKAVYEQSIILELITIESNKSSLNSIYNAIENSKSYTLAASVKQAKSLGYSWHKDSILQEEADLKTTIKILESELQSAKLSNRERVEIVNLEEGVFTAKDKFEAFETRVSKYLIGNRGIEITSLKKVQQGLKNGDLLIDYFAGKTKLYAVAISKSTARVYEFPAYRQSIRLYRKSILQTTSTQEFEQVAYQTYNLILSPILSDFGGSARLIIIPDQQLGNISFDALVSKKKQGSSFKNLEYLLNEYTIFQHQSASLYMAYNDDEKRAEGYIGFAPEFSKEELEELGNRDLRSGLQPLPYAKTEVEHIATLLNGITETGSNANEEKFKLEAVNYNILHIASHAIIDNERPIYSKLVFSNGDSTQYEDGNLYSFEIYGLRLKANLVTLSACNTGSGKFYEGEGIFSLGRAFLIAGAQSVLTSLWEVSDQSTSQIMMSFYTYLKEGKNKPEALRQAKLDYLKNADGLTANPYYWAGFVYTGKPEPIYKSNTFYYWLAAIFLLIILASIFTQKARQTKGK